MKNIDFYRLDGHLLKTFLTVLEESSVSHAATRLDVTQSTVSHALNRLRAILGDPLFVRSGQGLTPTETALALKAPVQEVLDNLRALTDNRPFDPQSEAMHFIIAANDMQRDLVFPELIQNAWADDIDITMELRPSGVPSVSLLRDARCDLILTPLPPDAPDLFQQKLFSGSSMVFYDPDHRDPPTTKDDYFAARHASVQFALGGSSNGTIAPLDFTDLPSPKITVSNFAGLQNFILGSDLLTTQIEHMHLSSLSRLAMAPLPFATKPVSVFMVWHGRTANDPAHKWLREQVRVITRPL